MIILGIDPGSRRTGWGIIQAGSRNLVSIGFGVIRTGTSLPLTDRLLEIHDGLAAVIASYQPGEAAVEGIFHSGANANFQSTLKLGHARGAALLAIARHGLKVEEYAPAMVKKSLVGHGRAEKWQIQGMIRTLLALPEPPPEDAADALAVAMCHGFRIQTAGRGMLP